MKYLSYLSYRFLNGKVNVHLRKMTMQATSSYVKLPKIGLFIGNGFPLTEHLCLLYCLKKNVISNNLEEKNMRFGVISFVAFS